jgi:DNA-binding NtrC family response regulator
MHSSRVLIVDDDAAMREALEVVFSAAGHACELAQDAFAALEVVGRQTFDVVLCDVVMDGMSGLELLDRVKRTHPALPFIVITGAGGVPQAVDAIKRGAFEYVVKPCSATELTRIVESALDERSHPSERARLSCPPASARRWELVGTGPAMRTLQTAIDFVARSSAPVLVTGETGAGKELVARAIHARSSRCGPRSPKTFWKPSCSDTFGAPSPVPRNRAKGCSPRPTVARCCSTKSATCPSRCR